MFIVRSKEGTPFWTPLGHRHAMTVEMQVIESEGKTGGDDGDRTRHSSILSTRYKHIGLPWGYIPSPGGFLNRLREAMIFNNPYPSRPHKAKEDNFMYI
jgi:hypothetical protein